MRKILIAVSLCLVMLLTACTGISESDGVSAKDAELTQTVETLDGHFTITVPENWSVDYSYSDDYMSENNMVLCYTDNDITFMNVYFYDNTLYDYPLDTAMNDNAGYFGENLLVDYEDMRLDGMDVYTAEYSMVDVSVDGKTEFNYHGFDYIIETAYGILDIDIYYCQEVFEAKIIKPSESQLELIQEIAESMEVLD